MKITKRDINDVVEFKTIAANNPRVAIRSCGVMSVMEHNPMQGQTTIGGNGIWLQVSESYEQVLEKLGWQSEAPFEDDPTRCAVCGWTMAENNGAGCTPGDCSMRPRPETLYSPERAKREALEK